MKTHITLQLAGLFACTFLATAGFISAQTQPTEATKERLRAQAQKIREELRFATVDRNRNGWDDAWEKKYPVFTTDKTGDSDGDGISNWEEMLDGTDPTRANKKGEVYVSAEDKARHEKQKKEAEEVHRLLMAPKLAAGLETASRKRPEAEKSDWLDEKMQRDGLLDFAVRIKAQGEQERQAALARIADTPLGDMVRDGVFGIKRFDENGVPVLIHSHALANADSISTDELWPGGSSSAPDLKGTGTTLGIWEFGGHPYYTHPELNFRAVDGEGVVTPAILARPHATQVGGVLTGLGVLASSKGMSFDASASLLAYDSVDDISEMATAAAAGLKISNHSYAQPNGWSFNATLPYSQWVWTGANTAGEDIRFSFYSVDSRQVDITAYDAPNYLPVWSAGNDNGETGPIAGDAYWMAAGYGTTTSHPADNGSGGFDTLPAYATAKNALVVGAVNPVSGGYSGSGGVSIASFSSRGPTDDGRIKPDLVADGVSVIAPTFEQTRPSPVTGFSFEEANLAVNGTPAAATGWTAVPGATNGGWGLAYRIQFNPGAQNFAGFGTHTLGLAGIGTQVYQDLPGVSIVANKEHFLRVRIGKHPNTQVTDPASVYRLRVYTNGFTNLVATRTIAASAITNAFQDEFLQFTLASPPAGNVRIVLEHGGPTFTANGGFVNLLFFDAVQFEYSHGSTVTTYTDGSAHGREPVSGTSFSAPAVSGSINLLHELNELRGGNALWGSTWKTLVIATADDAGTDGPDFTYGWGLMNTKKAAEHLESQLLLNRNQRKPSFIRQNVLFDGKQPEYKVKAKGGEDLVVTLGYTDPAYQNATVAAASGGIPANTLDPALSMLINDLDLEVVTPGGTVIGPWLTNPASPSAAATAPATGNDDDRNNVKQVRILAANVIAGGIYTVRVKQDGVLRTARKVPATTNYELVTTQSGQPAFQRFSLVMRGNMERPEDSFEMTEMVRTGAQHYIQWRSVKGIRYRVETSTDMVNWSEVPGDVDATSELTPLTITAASSTEDRRFYRIKEVTP